MSPTGSTGGRNDAPPRPPRNAAWRLPEVTRRRLWPTALLYSALATLATLTNDAHDYVGDNRFEQFWAPAGRLLRETTLWDATRGIGRVGEEFWPVTYPIALLRWIGLSPALTERFWHAGVLVVAGLGMAYLLRVFLGRIGPAAVLGGLVYMFNPFTATFLLPSVLFWNYAIAPWLLVMFLRGVGDSRPWRWAAGFALLVFSAGNADLPGTFFAALWVLPAAAWLVLVDRGATWRQVFGWLARAAALTALTCAAALAKTMLGAEPLAQRLQFTELPERVNTTSSWSETWRGLGFWLSYIGDTSGAERLPGGTYYYESAAGVIVTFVAPIIAAVVLWKSRWRGRALFGGIAVLSLVLMVGSYPPSDPPPTGFLLLRSYEAFSGLASLRNTYKAGSGLLMAVAGLVAIGFAIATLRLERFRPAYRALLGATAVLLVFITSLPFWNGGLYPERYRVREVPGYWQEAFAFLDQQPGDGRVLVLPGTTKTEYRWGGEPGHEDDLLDAFLRRHPGVKSTAFPLSGAESANLIDALEARIADQTLAPGEIGPIARALGIERVVIRNDLDWERSQVARPAYLAAVRSDPDLAIERTFGEVGEQVVDADDRTFSARSERSLTPVEVYRVQGTSGGGGARRLARADVAPLLVSGDGSAWPEAAAAGLLTGDRAVEYTGDLGPSALRARLRRGSPLLITDTNRRRLTRIRGAVPTRSQTLSTGQDLDQPAQSLFPRPGSQTVAEFPAAREIEASSSGTRITGFQPWLRPANAFDGNYTTSWLTGGLEEAEGAYVRVNFRQPITIDQVNLLPFIPDDAGRQVTAVTLRFSGGGSKQVQLDASGPTEVDVPARQTSFLEVRIDEVNRPGTAAVGFREITIPGVDLNEVIALPDDVARAAESDDALRAAIAAAPLRYLFERVRGVGAQNEEVALRRSFRVPGRRAFSLSGNLGVDIATTDQELDRLLSSLRNDGVSAFGTSRANGSLANRGLNAVDGDPETAWGAIPRDGEALTVRFPSRTVTRIRVTTPGDTESSPVNRVTVLVGGREESVDLEAEPGCAGSPCPQSGTVEVPPTQTNKVEVQLAATVAGQSRLPARLSEVAITDDEGDPVRTTGATSAAEAPCGDTSLTVDGRPIPIRLADSDPTRLLDGEPVTFTACDELVLSQGRHALRTADPIIQDLVLASGEVPSSPVTEDPRVEVLSSGSGHLRLRIDSPGDTLVSTGQSFDPGWRATVRGESLGSPRAVDTLSTWSLGAGDHVVDLAYAPDRTFRGALLATLAGLGLCLAILLRPSPRPRDRDLRGSRREPQQVPDHPAAQAP